MVQLAELTPNTRRGARGLILPAASQIGAANESELLPQTVRELERLALRPREIALDGGFPVEAANRHSQPPACSSPADNTRDHGAQRNGSRATAPAAKAASATSNGATACADRG
jgi:hypothetical protein